MSSSGSEQSFRRQIFFPRLVRCLSECWAASSAKWKAVPAVSGTGEQSWIFETSVGEMEELSLENPQTYDIGGALT